MGYTSDYAQKMMSGSDKPKAGKKSKGASNYHAGKEYDRVSANKAKIKAMSDTNPNNPNY